MEIINFDNKLEYDGFWYLPAQPDNMVGGTLSYYPEEKIVLKIIGCFGHPINSVLNNDDKESVIYGKISNSQDVTLFVVSKNVSLNFSAGFPITEYRCSYMVLGKCIKDFEEKCNYWANSIIPELSYWCNMNKIHRCINDEDITITLQKNCDGNYSINKTTINDNTSITLLQEVTFEDSHHSIKIYQYPYIEICKKEKCSINELLSDIRIYEQFLSVATLTVVKSSCIKIFDKNLYQLVEDEKHFKPIFIVSPRLISQSFESKSIKRTDFLYQYSTISNCYSIILKRWFNSPKEFAPIKAHLISSLDKKTTFSSVDFLIVIQALDGFWSRFREAAYKQANNMKQKSRVCMRIKLCEIISEFSDIEAVKKMHICIKAIVDSRDYYSHFYTPKTSDIVLSGTDLYTLTHKLRILLICCVLSLVGFNHIQINEIIKKSDSNLLHI